MIEKYINITDFIPENFNDSTMKEQIGMLEQFADYLHEQFGLSNNYEIIFSPIKEESLAQFSIDRNAVLLNKELFDTYKSVMDNPENYTNASIESFKTYSYDLCCALVHELKHAQHMKNIKMDRKNMKI